MDKVTLITQLIKRHGFGLAKSLIEILRYANKQGMHGMETGYTTPSKENLSSLG